MLLGWVDECEGAYLYGISVMASLSDLRILYHKHLVRTLYRVQKSAELVEPLTGFETRQACGHLESSTSWNDVSRDGKFALRALLRL